MKLVKGAFLAYKDALNGDYSIKDSNEDRILNMVREAIGELREELLANNGGEEIWNEKIVDPALVVTEAFKNAVSAASLIMTTDCVIVKKEFDD